MDIFIRIFTLIIYGSLLYELVGIPVPSIASTYQLFFTKDELTQASLLTKVRNWPFLLKVIFLILPTCIVVIVYMLPLAQAIWPPIKSILYSISLPYPFFFIFLGLVLAVLGRIIGLHAAWHMHFHSDEKRPLEINGLFSLSRNPILLGMYFTFLGLWFLYPNWVMGIGFLLFIGNMHFRVLLEEDFLNWQYGASYQSFAAKTRRYL